MLLRLGHTDVTGMDLIQEHGGHAELGAGPTGVVVTLKDLADQRIGMRRWIPHGGDRRDRLPRDAGAGLQFA